MRVKGYRLVGYENRMLKKEDFNDDKKDAGELGSGHTVTALYEIIPAGSDEEIPGVDKLKYQKSQITEEAEDSDDVMTVKFRYKKPDKDKSILLRKTVSEDSFRELNELSDNIKFASAVAQFGMLLRKSEFSHSANFNSVLTLAKEAKGKDENGYRAEFIQLVEKAKSLKNSEKPSIPKVSWTQPGKEKRGE